MDLTAVVHRLPTVGSEDAAVLQFPPRPRRTLRVGIVGHRPNRLASSDLDSLQALVAKTLAALADGVQALAQDAEMSGVYSGAPPEIRVVTGIAYGIDEMAMKAVTMLRTESAKCATDRDTELKPVQWKLELVSPAPLNVCAIHAWGDRADQTSDPDRQVASCVARWQSVRECADAIAELPIVWARSQATGGLSGPPGLLDALLMTDAERHSATWGPEHGYEMSYAPAAEFLLRNIDVLIAFWDGGPSGGAGGTVEIIEGAHANAIPVILTKIDEHGPMPRRLAAFQRDDLGKEMVGWHRPIGQVELAQGSIFDDPMAMLLKPLFLPPSDKQAEPEHTHHDHQHGKDHGGEHDHHLSVGTYFAEQLTAFESSRTYDRFFDFWLGKRGPTARAILGGLAERLCKLPLVIKAMQRHATRQQIDAGYRLNPRQAQDKRHWSEQTWTAFLRDMPIAPEQRLKIKDALHARFIVADMLAVDYANRYRSSVISSYLLSTLAVTLAIVGVAFAGDSKILKAVLLAAEFGIITWILAMVSASRRDQHHSKLVHYRVLAESLRHMLFLASIGEYPSPGTRGQNWVSWYVLATARELGMPSGRFTPELLAQTIASVSAAEVLPQIAYHGRAAKKLSHVNHRLHGFGEMLFGATLASVVMSILLIVGYYAFSHPAWAMGLKFTGCAAAILPAVGAALTGIRYALDLETKSERHEEMASRLRALNVKFDQAKAEPRWSTTRDTLGALEELLIRDVDQFQSNYARRGLTVPA
jgi:hypothetical protein